MSRLTAWAQLWSSPRMRPEAVSDAYGAAGMCSPEVRSRRSDMFAEKRTAGTWPRRICDRVRRCWRIQTGQRAVADGLGDRWQMRYGRRLGSHNDRRIKRDRCVPVADHLQRGRKSYFRARGRRCHRHFHKRSGKTERGARFETARHGVPAAQAKLDPLIERCPIRRNQA